jgi:hypothetical protein
MFNFASKRNRDSFLAIALSGFWLLSGAQAFCRNDVRVPTFRPPTVKSPAPKTPTTKGSSRRSASKNRKVSDPAKLEVKKQVKPIEVKTTQSSEDAPGDTPVLVEPSNRPPEPDPEGNKVRSLFPNAAVAHVTEDKSFRLMVTIDGTKFDRETDDLMRLEKGSVLLSPNHKVHIETPACSLDLQEGSVVSIDSTEDSTYIRDFHDRWKGHVVVKVNDKEINLMPGTELIVTRETDPDKAWRNAVRHHIRRRGLKQFSSGAHLIVFKGDFSIPDAMLKSNHFLYLKNLNDAKAHAVIDEVTKTAALLHITDHNGPFTLMR